MTPFNEIRRFKQMRKSTRLNDMMIFLSDKSFFNLKDIMQEYGISKSTAIRDIQSLEEIGMPIFSETGRNGRYGILKNRLLSPIIFTVDEMYALYFAMLTLNAYESTPFHLSIEKLKKKFETCLSDELINTMPVSATNTFFIAITSSVTSRILELAFCFTLKNKLNI